MKYTHILISIFVCQFSFVSTQNTLKIDGLVDSTKAGLMDDLSSDSTIIRSIDSLYQDSLKIKTTNEGLDTLKIKENLSASSMVYNYLKKNILYSSAIIIPIVYFILNDKEEKVKKTGPPPEWP
jgi:hypothetical protein|tara:strand:- start:103 stop:474 length:372 start_codon:yes stop_codon:yes gene_type:complete